jgi:UDP-N-acetylglucosamine diphosphorylase / glucose-1-phosphate thymidylyltransferase / UDP-N-acetylgalactosamine diphosphorylase / glucosamine-1-phosphate N-acetyltransferase / galactosamine-1-phosphate N-acetyltransferase
MQPPAVLQPPLALVLAGGANSRFWPLREKSLLPFLGQSLLHRHLATLAAAGIRDGVIVGTAANAAQLEAEAAALPAPRMRVVVQAEPRGMGDAILTAVRALPPGSGQALLVTQVHDLIAGDLLARVVAAYRANPRRTYLAAYRTPDYFPGGYFRLDGDRAVGLVEKPGAGNTPSDLVSVVIRLHHDVAGLARELDAAYAVGGPDDHYERAINTQMRQHEHSLVVHEGAWAAIKYPWHVLDAVELLLDGITAPTIAADAAIDRQAAISGNVVIAAGARLFAGAAVVGPAYVGPNTIVGNNALVRHSCVEADCVVGFGSEVARSYVGPGCWFHTNYVGDSVIGPGSTFGAGMVTANLRHDHRHVLSVVRGERIDSGRDKLGLVCGAQTAFGVQAASMPGVKVGEGSRVGPGVILYRDVPEHRRLLLRQDVVEQNLAP